MDRMEFYLGTNWQYVNVHSQSVSDSAAPFKLALKPQHLNFGLSPSYFPERNSVQGPLLVQVAVLSSDPFSRRSMHWAALAKGHSSTRAARGLYSSSRR